jgi:hypothetical protein
MGRTEEGEMMQQRSQRWKIVASGGVLLLSGALSGCGAIRLCSLFGCCPEIEHFDATPHRICPGGSATVSWNVRGDATLSASPARAATGAVDASGRRSFVLAQTTTFTLAVKGLEEFREQEVQVFAGADEEEDVGGQAECHGNELVATAKLPPGDWDDLARVATVRENQFAALRPLTVVHAGRTATLTGAAPSAALAGTKVSGDWEIRSPLSPGEGCNPPPALELTVRVECTP